MKNIKLFEAYSESHYQNLILKVKDMVSSDKPKAEILSLLSKYTNTDSKDLDYLRIIINRIKREIRRNPKYVVTRDDSREIKKRDGSTQMKYDMDYKYFLIYYTDEYPRMEHFIKNQKSQCDVSFSKLPDNTEIEKIENSFKLLFYYIDFLLSVNKERLIVYKNEINYDNRIKSNLDKIDKLEDFYDESDLPLKDEFNTIMGIIKKIENLIQVAMSKL